MNRSEIIKAIMIQLVKAIVVSAISITISLLFANEISKIGNLIIEKRKLAMVMEKRSTIISKIRSDLRVVNDNQKIIENALPPKDNILDFVSSLENIANKNSLQYSYKFGTPSAPSTQGEFNISTIDYSLNINGNIFTLINYLKDFEKLKYFTGINSITLSAPQDTGWDGNSTMTIQAKLYSR